MSDNTEALSELELLWREINYTDPGEYDKPWERLVQAHKAVVRALESPSVPEGWVRLDALYCERLPPVRDYIIAFRWVRDMPHIRQKRGTDDGYKDPRHWVGALMYYGYTHWQPFNAPKTQD